MGPPIKSFTIASETKSRNYLVAWGWPKSGNWGKGSHKVKIYIDNMLVGSKEFKLLNISSKTARKNRSKNKHSYNRNLVAGFSDQEDTNYIRGDRLPHLTKKSTAKSDRKKHEKVRVTKVMVANINNQIPAKNVIPHKHPEGKHQTRKVAVNALVQTNTGRQQGTRQNLQTHTHTSNDHLDHKQFDAEHKQFSKRQHQTASFEKNKYERPQQNNPPASTLRYRHSKRTFPAPKLVGKIRGKYSVWQVENDTAHPLYIRYQGKGTDRAVKVAPYTVKNIILKGGNYNIHGSLSNRNVRSFSKKYYFTLGGKYLSRFVVRNNGTLNKYTQKNQ